MSSRRKEIEWIAHRGYAARYPENTLLALTKAVEAGARNLEFDLQMTADGVPVLLHDVDLIRTGGRSERIADLAADDLVGISVHEPARCGERFVPEPIPRLAEAVGRLREWSHVRAFVELKRAALESFGEVPMIERVVAELEPIVDRAVVISFAADAVARARDLGAREIGWVIERWGRQARDRAHELRPDVLFVNHTKVPEDESLWPGPWRWAVYEVVDLELAYRLVARGVDYIETMAVGEMVQAVVRAGAGAEP